jgi:hypothetical protein
MIFYVAFFPSFVNGSTNIKLVFEGSSDTEQFVILLDELRVHSKRVSDELGWYPLYIEKKPLDISKPYNFEYLLAQNSKLPIGNYDKISLGIKSSSIEINGSLVQISVTSPIIIQLNFTIYKDAPKDLTLLLKIDMESTIEEKRLILEMIGLEDN